MIDLADPLTPADCDLRGLPFMPLDVARLLDSDMFALSTGEEFKAAVALWCKSWTQVPAASLPDDDRILAHLSGAGSSWRRVKELALRNWIRCADGRLYHPVVAEQALEAWDRRGEWREQRANKNDRQRRWRERQKELSAQLRGMGLSPPSGASLETLERMLRDASVDAPVDAQPSTLPSTVDARETPLTGTGTETPPNPRKVDAEDSLHRRVVEAIVKAAGMANIPSDHTLAKSWLALPGMELDRDIIPVVRRVADQVKASGGKTPFKFRLFDAAIRDQHAKDEAEIARYRRTAQASANGAGS